MFDSLPEPSLTLNNGVPLRLSERLVDDRSTMANGDCSGDADLEALVAAVARERDRQAFASLFAHFAPRLKAYMRRGGASDEAAEDIAQEAMVQVWRKADTFDPSRAAVSTWVFTIARNKRIDRIRKEGRPALDEESYRAEMETDDGPMDLVAHDQTSRHLRSLISELPPEQEQVIEKAFFEDKPHSAIAEELDLPLGTVKSRIRLALNRLKSGIPDDAL